jgi:putative solute:sodium symporter small subunit
MSSDQDQQRAYWKANVRLVTILLSIWAFVSLGCGILFVEQLNQISMGGFKLGFWFAQQGSIIVFVCLIFIYVRQMNRLDKEYGVEEEDAE